MRKKRIQVLYEHSGDYRPFSSSYIRLLRPLNHPGIITDFDFIITPILLDQPTDFVFIDRLVTLTKLSSAEKLINKIQDLKAKLIFFTDDDLSSEEFRPLQPIDDVPQLFEFLVRSASITIVSTDRLRTCLSKYNTACYVIPNFLDERLIIRTKTSNYSRDQFIVGYMGTPTHNYDLELVIPAIREFQNLYSNVSVEFIGVNNNSGFYGIRGLNELRYKSIFPKIDETEYPLFMLWWTSTRRWDLAIAPLQQNEFNLNKSDIKLLDYAASDTPGIFTDIQGYQSSVPKRGVLVDNSFDSWFSALKSLYDNQELRKSLAAEATDYLFSERILHKGISEYNQFLKML